eukprot:2169135-Amphidinium_carterae.1
MQLHVPGVLVRLVCKLTMLPAPALRAMQLPGSPVLWLQREEGFTSWFDTFEQVGAGTFA